MRRPCQNCCSLVWIPQFLRNRVNKVVEDHQSKNLPCSGEHSDATKVLTVCIFASVLEEGNNNCIMKLFSIMSSSYMLVKILWNILRVSGTAALKISTGTPLCLDVLLMLDCLIAFLTSSRVEGRSRSSIIAFCGIKSRAVGSTVEGLLTRLEKCFLHHLMMIPLSLSKVMLWEESKEVVLVYKGPYTALKELLKSAGHHLPCCSTNYLVCFRVPFWLYSSGTWSSLTLIVLLHHPAILQRYCNFPSTAC